MAIPTIKQLHNDAFNPDLSHWSIHSVYSLLNAALLSAAIDPLNYDFYEDDDVISSIRKSKPINWQWAVSILIGLKQSVCLGELTAKKIVIKQSEYNGDISLSEMRQEDLTVDSIEYVCIFRTIITKQALITWYKEKGFIQNNRFHDIRLLEKPRIINNSNMLQPVSQSLLPAPRYKTPAIECMEEVIKQFWSTYDPEDNNMKPPTQIEILTWLEKQGHKYGVTSENMRKAIDSIARHPKAKVGGKTKLG